jgi:hypothetical protein
VSVSSRKNTKPKAEAIETDGPEETTEVTGKVDQAEVADQVGQTVNAGFEGNGRTVSAGEGYQSPEFKRIRRNLQSQTERDKAGKAACLAAEKCGKEG